MAGSSNYFIKQKEEFERKRWLPLTQLSSFIGRAIKQGLKQGVRDELERIESLNKYLPPIICEEILKNNLPVKVVPSLKDNHSGEYDVERNEILLNAGVDRKACAEHLSKTGVKVEPDQVLIWTFFHELHHFNKKKELEKIAGVSSFKQAVMFRQNSEADANDYATRRFWDWKANVWQQYDFHRWLNEKMSSIDKVP